MNRARFFPTVSCILALLISGCTPEAPRPVAAQVEVLSPRPVEGEKSEPRPLVVVLHGYKGSPFLESLYFMFSRFVDSKRFHLVYLEGTRDGDGHRFWNASEACCNLDHIPIDDSAYISGVIRGIKSRLPISQVYVLGHSNGAFMAYRLLCDHGDLIDGVVSLGGADASRVGCVAFTKPKKILHIHGTNDQVISDQGGSFHGLPAYPSVSDTLSHWRRKLGCREAVTESKNYSNAILGEDSGLRHFECAGQNHLTQIEILGGSHIPFINDSFRNEVLDLLLK